MANLDQQNGLKPYERLIRARKYIAGSTVYPGDPVAIAADGQVDSSVTGPLLGVALNYATVGQDLMVADDPQQMFTVQASASLAVTDVACNAALTLGTASTLYKRSACVLDASSAGTLATREAKIVAIDESVNNAAGSTLVDVVIKINNHFLASGTGTAGIA